MTQEHPITPPPELVQQWYNECPEANEASLPYVATQAARWGADQELEACVEHLKRIWSPSDTIDSLRAARRPKPPSVKDEALKALRSIERGLGRPEDTETIRRALEALDD